MIVRGLDQSSRTGAASLVLAIVAVLLISAIVACSGSPPAKPLTFATPAPATESLAARAPTATVAVATTTQDPPVAPTVATILSPPTAEPTATSESALKVSEAVFEASEAAYGLLTELVDDLGHRVAGTPQELSAAEILRGQLDSYGYSAQLQPFSIEFFDLTGFVRGQRELATINVKSPVQMTLPGMPVTTAPSEAKGEGRRAKERCSLCSGSG